jgi:hypothetical protein
MRAIFAQGLWGKATTVNTDIVARQTINAAMKERRTAAPGLLNRLLSLTAGMIPGSFSVQLVAHRWHIAQEQRAVTWQSFAAPQDKAAQRPFVISTVNPGI